MEKIILETVADVPVCAAAVGWQGAMTRVCKEE
jgi:hypothetical protein